jgi:hypothetical protein
MEAKAWQKEREASCHTVLDYRLLIMMGRHSRLPAPPISLLQVAYSATPFQCDASSADNVKALSICDCNGFRAVESLETELPITVQSEGAVKRGF